jgi:hypothetical protein
MTMADENLSNKNSQQGHPSSTFKILCKVQQHAQQILAKLNYILDIHVLYNCIVSLFSFLFASTTPTTAVI